MVNWIRNHDDIKYYNHFCTKLRPSGERTSGTRNDFLTSLVNGNKRWYHCSCTEEIVFRKCFKKAFPNKWIFIILSALVFGSLHVITTMTSPLELLYIIPYGALGASFAMMYQKTGTIYTSVAMHMFHNTALTILSILA